jgi:phosphohistidine swiveling domain-containing protein/DNA-binding Xre family transcriptional regulator
MIRLKFEEMSQKIGKNISEIARETKINRNTIQALALGKVSGLKFETLDKLCQVYRLKISDILEFEGKKKVEVPAEKHKLYKQEGECVPFTMYPPSLTAATYVLPGEDKPAFGALYTHFKGSYTHAFWDDAAMRRASRAFYNRYSERSVLNALYNEFMAGSAAIDVLYRRTFTGEIAKMDQSELVAFLKELQTGCQKFWTTSIFIDCFDVGVDQEIIREIAKTSGLDTNDVQVLTTPTELTFAGDRKRRLFEIIDGIKTQKWTREKIGQFVVSSAAVQKYRQDFDYVASNYASVKHITNQQIAEEMWDYLQHLDSWKKEYKELSRYEEDHEAAMATVLKKKKLKENPLWMFERLTIWREFRKKANLMSIHVQDAVLERVEALTGIPKKYLQYLVPDEVANALKGLVSLEELAKRREDGVMLNFEGSKFEMLHGAQADSLLREYNDRLGSESTSTIVYGQTACQGYAKGVARVILDESQFHRFKEGEILVTGMTRPEFLPLMKKSAGIVTNEGGITCHAAIVSRELGKPCIIGTKNATVLINDGALVEVRANHATVRILS